VWSFWTVACIVLLLPAPAHTDDQSLEAAVVAYNHAIMQAGVTGDTSPLFRTATKEVATKTHLWIKSWQDSALFMHAVLQKIVFDKPEEYESKATVRSNEIWHYRYYNPRNKSIDYPLTEITYRMEYSLVKELGKWKVDGTKVLSEKKKKLQK